MRHHILLAIAASSLLLAFISGCADPTVVVRISQVARDRAQYEGDRVRVAGVVRQPPHWTEDGAVFIVSDPDSPSSLLRVVYRGAKAPTPTPDGTTSVTWIGGQVIFAGRFDGQALQATSLVVKMGGPYETSPAASGP